MTERPTVAHLVTPYLFLTGGWIHSQLVHARSVRPIVVTQGREHESLFPFTPVYDLAPQGAASRAGFVFSKYLLGQYPAAPYRRVLEREDVRLWHAHLGWEGARTAHVAKDPRRPFVVSFYGRDGTMLARNPYWRTLYRRLFARADRVVAEGPFMAETLVSIGAPRDRVRVVHLGIPLDEFPYRERTAPEDPGAPIVALLAASFREKKGIAYALEAFRRVAPRHPRARLRLLGDGPLRGEIERLAATPEIRGRVELLGYQPPNVYRAELQKADLFLAPSVLARDGDSEGGAPVCLLEAQASGIPVLASTHCDIPEVTRANASALLAPERDSETLAANWDTLLSEPQRWPAMGRAGRAHIEAEFDIARQVERMADLYRELL